MKKLNKIKTLLEGNYNFKSDVLIKTKEDLFQHISENLPYALELFFKQETNVSIKFNKPEIRPQKQNKMHSTNNDNYYLEITSNNISGKNNLGLFSFIYDHIVFVLETTFSVEEKNGKLKKFDDFIKLNILISWEDKTGDIGSKQFYFNHSFEKVFYNLTENKIVSYK